MEDHVDWELPMGAAGQLLGGSTVEAELDRVFTFRHQRLRNDLDRIALPALCDRGGQPANSAANDEYRLQIHCRPPLPMVRKTYEAL